MSKKTKQYIPYILAVILLVGLVVMVQTQKPLQGKSSHTSFAQDAGYFYLPPGSANVSGVTEEQYRQLIVDFQSKYMMPVFKTTGKPLLISYDWVNPYFAGGSMDKGTYLQVILWGGTARAPGASLEVLAGILCHEIGHTMGEEPRQTFAGAEWSSSEGQSDFFTGRTCLPEFLSAHPELATNISEEALSVCEGNLLCARTAQVGLEMVRFFQKYDSQKSDAVSLLTPAPAAQELLRNVYPSVQCRLDTYLAGARCQLNGTCRPPACWFPHQQEDSQHHQQNTDPA
ncbi:hypothetical protein EZJ49_14535 [Bdellovibrio bacteriovorus]|uniref:hypothetical protein n=1 Tax=Bdellovibrio bacteriovorus TaxID=959 RepID=UPI0021D231A3|nr:hypothetical protein [Bdellovibrio bacteriovorus]UXR64282.1 hypothetical protein EZJ49_14535 [Bdellovibrio bacteriovorus]